MRAAAERLFSCVSDADWRRHSANPGWTVGEVLTHLTWSLEQVPREVESARRGRGMYNLPRLVRDPLSTVVTRMLARRYTLRRLARQYDAAYAAALHTLDGVGDDEWRRGASFYGEGFRDIEALFREQARHLEEHGRDIRAVLLRAAEDSPASDLAVESV